MSFDTILCGGEMDIFMQKFKIHSKLDGKRIDKAVIAMFPTLPSGALYKALRKKDIKVNGNRVKEDYIVKIGDEVQVYIVDSILLGENISSIAKYHFDVIYEDQNIMIVNKHQGISVHADSTDDKYTLIDEIQSYIDIEHNGTHRKAMLCHRLDRNTGGLIIIALNQESHDIMLDLIKMRKITKLYKCIVHGKMQKDSEKLKAYLKKDMNNSKVFISDKPGRDFQSIETSYKVISYNKASNTSLIEVNLITGRTHQIRAHLAHIGNPIIGDGKYGSNIINRPFKTKRQQLWAYKIIFNFDDENAGVLNYLKDKSFEINPKFDI